MKLDNLIFGQKLYKMPEIGGRGVEVSQAMPERNYFFSQEAVPNTFRRGLAQFNVLLG